MRTIQCLTACGLFAVLTSTCLAQDAGSEPESAEVSEKQTVSSDLLRDFPTVAGRWSAEKAMAFTSPRCPSRR